MKTKRNVRKKLSLLALFFVIGGSIGMRDGNAMGSPNLLGITEGTIFKGVFAETLNVGESRTKTIRADLKFNWTGVKLINGQTYKFIVGSPEWNNGVKETDAEGYEGNIVFPGTGERRYPNYRWMALVGALFTYDDQYSYTGKSFLIAKGRTWKATKTGVLAAFANDCAECYNDNSRVVTLTIKRVE
ncbi:MAG: hypothetical protein ACT4O9_10480 [Blastocatellia bacterium]